MSDMVKPLYETPDVDLGEPVEIEIVPDEIEVDIEGMVEEAAEVGMAMAGDLLPHGANLVLGMTDAELAPLGQRVIELYEADERSRVDWKDAYQDALKLLGLKVEKRQDPWPNACGVIHPMVTEAIIRFQSTTIMELFPLSGPVKVKIEGKTDERLEEVRTRLQAELNYVCTTVMPEYRTEIEQGLWRLGTAGMSFRKVWNDPTKRRPVAQTISAEDIVVPYGSTHIFSAPRVTHIIKMHKDEVERMIAAGWWYEVDLPPVLAEYSESEQKEGEQQGQTATLEFDDRYIFYEMQIDLDLPGFPHMGTNGKPDGLALPYVVTVERQSQKVMAVRRNWSEGDITFQRQQSISAQCYIPGWGFYGIGLLTLMAGLATGATSILRQTVDAGTLANLPAGFKGKGFKTRNDSTPLRPGEFRDVEIYSGKLADSIYQVRLGTPSEVLVALMGNMVEEGRRLGAVAELPTKTGEMPVGTIVAMIEHQTKPQSAVQARIYAAFCQEINLIVDCLKKAHHQYLCPQGRGHDFMNDVREAMSFLPVADPSAASSAVRILQAQAAVELSAQAPTMYDKPYVHRAMLKAMGVGDVDAMIPGTDNVMPADPISENMALITGKPAKAGITQDHKAHIQAHMALIHDPRMSMVIGQSPNAAQIQTAIMAHIAEHAAFMHREEIMKALGFVIPTTPLPAGLENRMAPLIADAAMQAAMAGKAKESQQQQQEADQDPMVQLQKADLAIRNKDIDNKHEIAMGKLKLQAAKDGSDAALNGLKLQDARRQAGMALVERVLNKGQTHGN